MSGDDQDRLDRRLDLLKQLEGRGVVKRATDYFARQAPPSAASPAGRPSRSAFASLFPEAEFLPLAGRVCAVVRNAATLCGRRTSQGYQCPVDPYGGPPRPEVLAAFTGDPRWADLDPARIVYLDTETTSLALGTGTYTFLIGLGRFTDAGFTVNQYFMEDYADEGALVEAVDAALAEAQALVSYNGRTFDVPLLECRWRLQRRRPRFPELHLDLLHTARRLWRLRLPDCSLATVESQILGIHRVSDVDGSWVPRIYFDFTRGLRPERIVPVLDHHAQDIYSLGALAAAVLAAWSNPADPRFAHAADQWGLAKICELRGRAAEAIACLEAAVLAARDEDLGFRLAMHLARTYKRRGRVADAVAVWESRLGQCHAERLDPLIELAKHAEHTLKDYAAARGWAERALRLLEGRADLSWLTREGIPDTPEALARQIAALARRVTRLDTRKERAEKKKPRRKKQE